MVLSKFVSRVGFAAGLGCSIHVFFEYVCDFVVCSGESMQPTLYSHNILVCNKVAKRFKDYKRNDIVIAIHPQNPHNFICKRLIGLPGDTVIMGSAPASTSNKESDDENEEDENKIIFISPGSCWLEGDNRINSSDSRNYGPVPLGLIKSKVLARIWPVNDFKIF